VVIEPFRGFRDLICTIPGIGGYTADVVVAETGADMARFPTAQHLASWAGTTPGNNESAGKVKSRRTRPGNPYLQGALGTAAMSIPHIRDTYLAAKYRRIATRRGPLRANVAVQRALLVAIWNIATTNTPYHDPGGDYFTRLTSIFSSGVIPRCPYKVGSLFWRRDHKPALLQGSASFERNDAIVEMHRLRGVCEFCWRILWAAPVTVKFINHVLAEFNECTGPTQATTIILPI
jgi:hypothetical protein